MDPQPHDHAKDTGSFEQKGPIAAWAASHGLDAHTGLVLAGCILAHVTGESVMFQDNNGLNGLPPPSFVGLESDLALRSALASLTGPLGTTQRALLLKTREHETADIDQAMAQCNRTQCKLMEDFEHNENSNSGFFPRESHRGIGSDMQVKRRSIRLESLIRPRFLVEGSPPEDPAQALVSYHFASGFLAGGVERLPADERRRHQRLDLLARFVHGEEITIKSGSVKERVSASLRGVILFPDEQFDWLLDHRRDFFRLCVPVSPDASASLPDQLDSRGVDDFHFIFSREVNHLLAIRRAFAAANAKFVSQDWEGHFMGLRRDFIRECSALPPALRTPSISCLPDLVAWTLLRLGDGSLPDDVICAQALSAARHVRNNALRIFTAHDNAREAARRKQIAERLIGRLLRLGPCKRRELVRGFDDMRMIVHEPVIRVLIQIGVFVENDDKTLIIGSVPTNSLPPTLFIETPALS